MTGAYRQQAPSHIAPAITPLERARTGPGAFSSDGMPMSIGYFGAPSTPFADITGHSPVMLDSVALSVASPGASPHAGPPPPPPTPLGRWRSQTDGAVMSHGHLGTPSSPCDPYLAVAVRKHFGHVVLGGSQFGSCTNSPVHSSLASPTTSPFLSPAASPFGSPTLRPVHSPINVNSWQLVGQRMGSIFQDPGLLSSPIGSPMNSFASSFAGSPMGSMGRPVVAGEFSLDAISFSALPPAAHLPVPSRNGALCPAG